VWDIRGDVEESKQITMIRKHTCGGTKFGESLRTGTVDAVVEANA
jgi:hypothetical protein